VTKPKASRAEIRELLAQQPRKAPDRTITRLEATRHLIHAAIRMIFWEEDPFAVHLTASSANRVLIDLAIAKGVTFQFDWNSRLKDDYKQLGLAILSGTYNFLRHADETPDEVHGVRNIVQRNDLDILMASKRFKEIAGRSTQHMTSFSHLMLAQYPKIFRDFDPPSDVPIKPQDRVLVGCAFSGFRDIIPHARYTGLDPNFADEDPMRGPGPITAAAARNPTVSRPQLS
jgi:hypothetical protein